MKKQFDNQSIIEALSTTPPKPSAAPMVEEEPLPDWIKDQIGTPAPPAPVPYHFNDELKRVIAVAIVVKKPLLLQGEPGCGKTQLAQAVAHALQLPLYTFYAKSSSKGQDLLYTYDAIARIYDVQMSSSKATDICNYLKLGPLGKAIAASTQSRSVVLIDEIDKADTDFPNDLLLELDEFEFYIHEADRLRIAGDRSQPPIVFITNNKERSLPDPFLRRCIFYHMEFPDSSTLLKIFEQHSIKSEFHNLAEQFITYLRKKSLQKKPGLSEIIDWLIYHQDSNLETLKTLPNLELLLKTEADAKRSNQLKDEFPIEES
jgi:MoxR-like ATPase